MAEIVRMPKLSDTMTEGVVAEWYKKVGDTVAEGELLAEIETDKATMEFESFYDGVLLHIGVEKGGSAPVNEILAIIGEKGEEVAPLLNDAMAGGTASSTAESQKAETAPAAAPANAATSSASEGRRIAASPLAKKMADERGIDLSTVTGSGENQRIVKRDIENYSSPTEKASHHATPLATTSFVDQAVSQMRKTIASRLSQSKFSAPHFYLTVTVDMESAMASRASINADGDVKVSFNDIVIKAAAGALRKHPQVNASWLGDTIRYYDHINIGVAVAVDEGLLVPVVRFADTKGLAQINQEVRAYAQKAKDKKLQPQDWEGSTFTISNLGMFGIEEFTAIVNPPDACILAVGSIRQVPVVKDGQIAVGNVMKVTLSCDHRVVDGATGAQFLQDFKQLMEHPIKLLI